MSTELTSYQQQLKLIAENFKQSEFSPWSPFLRNPHYQTIVGSGALSTKFFGFPKRTFQVSNERFETPDGDFFDVEFTEGFHDGPNADRSVLLLHGLESNSQGHLMTNFALACLDKGFSCCLVSFRGCSGVASRFGLPFINFFSKVYLFLI
jgi:predicted alpha/beta-fold hydrolase